MKMSEEKQPQQQQESMSAEPDPSIAATSVVAPSTFPVGAVDTTLGEKLPTTWDHAGEGLVISQADLEGAVHSSESRTIKHWNALPAGAWVQGPGLTELLAEGIKLAQGASRAAGTPIKEIKAVHALALPKLQMVLVKAVKEGTTDAVPARRDGKGPLIFNLSYLLREAEMEVTSGYREFYPVKKVSDSPIGPCIAILMAKAIKTRRVGEKEEESK